MQRRRRVKSALRLVAETLETRSLFTTLADVDLDGDLDAVRASAWYENTDGQGSFAEHPFSVQPGAKVSEHVADLDGDGDTDVLTSAGQWYENANSKAAFDIVHQWSDVPFDEVRLHDTDLDGDMDVIATMTGASASLLRNASDGTFHVQSTVFAPFLAAADFNADGLLDKVVKTGVDSFEVQQNQGDNAFASTLRFDPPDSGGVQMEFYRVGDVNGDGDEDIVWGQNFSLTRFDWTDIGGETHESGFFGIGDSMIFLGDIDRDGDQEGMAFMAVVFAAQWKYTEGHGGLRGSAGVEFPSSPCQFSDVGDVNGDGLLDLACKQGDFLWEDGSTWRVSSNVMPTPTGDVNGDGLFNSADLIAVFQAGEYEDDRANNSTWDEGDWNRDGEFDSADLVVAMQSGTYVVAVVNVTREQSAFARAYSESDFKRESSTSWSEAVANFDIAQDKQLLK